LLNQAIDKVVEELKDEPTLKQEIAHYWFGLLESKSLFAAAEYLALVYAPKRITKRMVNKGISKTLKTDSLQYMISISRLLHSVLSLDAL